MDYFLVINGQKQGPFDLVGLIKKIKNASLNAETLVSKTIDGPFIPANQVTELMQLLNDNAVANSHGASSHRDIKLSFRKYFSEGLDLWARHIISFSIIVGLILALTFFLSKILDGLLPEKYSFVGNVFVTFFAAFFYMAFFYIVLLAKRSHKVEVTEIKNIIKFASSSLAQASFVISLISIASVFGPMIGFLVWIGASIVLSYFVFVPFILFDGHKKLGYAAQLSFSRVAKVGSNNLGVILLLAIFNILMTFLPALASTGLLGFGLFISLPITVSAFAFIYDEIFG